MSFGLTRKTDYALLALTRLAEQAGDGGGRPISARRIAEKFDLPLPLLMNVLKDLARAHLITAQRGAGGGYSLARPAGQIRLADVVLAIEGPVSVTLCCNGDARTHDDQSQTCRLTGHCPTTGTMKQFNELILNALHNMTVADLIHGGISFQLLIERNGRTRVARPLHTLTRSAVGA
jgi:Rrf2 family protein